MLRAQGPHCKCGVPKLTVPTFSHAHPGWPSNVRPGSRVAALLRTTQSITPLRDEVGFGSSCAGSAKRESDDVSTKSGWHAQELYAPCVCAQLAQAVKLRTQGG